MLDVTQAQTSDAVPEWTVADRIIKARAFAGGLTQDQLAQRSGVSKSTVVRYEAGHQPGNRLYLVAIAEACGVNVGWLLDGVPRVTRWQFPYFQPELFDEPTAVIYDTIYSPYFEHEPEPAPYLPESIPA